MGRILFKRHSNKAVRPETRLQASNGFFQRNFNAFQYLTSNRHVYSNYYQTSSRHRRTRTVHSEGYFNANLERKSNKNTSNVRHDNSNHKRRGKRHLQPVDNRSGIYNRNKRRKYEHNVASRISKLKIYSNQRTDKINVVESTLNGDFSLENLTTNISKDSTTFDHINKIFMDTTQRHYRILRIEEILNPYLKLSYVLRKKEYALLYGEENVKEILLFHGTKKSNIEKIVKNNFDWRLHGKSHGNLFGKGVSFSPISNYASYYCDKTREKCMLAAYVLKYSSCEGNNFTIVPPVLNADNNLHYDTTEKPNGDVSVKFRDDEFYPRYLIYFVGSPIKRRHNC